MSITKCVDGSTPPRMRSYRDSTPAVLRAGSAASALHWPYCDIATPVQLLAGPPFQYWLPHSPKPPGSTSVTYAMHDETHVPKYVELVVNW